MLTTEAPHIVSSVKRFLSSMVLTVVLSVVAVLCCAPSSVAQVTAPTISPGTGVYTTAQPTATITAPSGTIHYTLDGTTPTVSSPVYSSPVSIGNPAVVKAIAVVSGTPSAVTTAYIQTDTNSTALPRSGLLLWLKGDFGTVTSGSNLTQWIDMSGSGNDASQSNSTNQPTLVSNAIGGLPAVHFNGFNSFMQIASGLSNFSSGASVFIVAVPQGTNAGARFFDFGNFSSGSIQDNLYLAETKPSGAALYAYSGSSGSNVSSASALSVGQAQLVEAIHNGSGSAMLLTNGNFGGKGTINNLANVTRNFNFIGTDHSNAACFNGQLAEILVYNSPLSDTDRAALENYIYSKYGLMPPRIDPFSGVYTDSQVQTVLLGGTFVSGDYLLVSVQDASLSGGQEIIQYYTFTGDTIKTIAAGLANAITSDAALQAIGVSATAAGNLVNVRSQSGHKTTYFVQPFNGMQINLGNFDQQLVSMTTSPGSSIFFTTDGTTPTTSSSLYTDPIAIDTSTTFKAIAVQAPYSNSSIAVSAHAIDSNALAVSADGLLLWLRSDAGVLTTSSNVSAWLDLSGNANDASQSNSSNQPTLVANAIANIPAISFAGSSQFIQLPSGFAHLTAGATIFVATKPSSVTGDDRFIDLGNGATSDNLIFEEPTSTDIGLLAYNGSSASSVTASNALSLGRYQVLGAIHNGTTTATIFANGAQSAQSTSMNSLNDLVRSSNFIGQSSGGGHYFNGQIAELLVYNRPLTASERLRLETYILPRYEAAPPPPVPILSVATSTLSAPTQVAITAPLGATVHITRDGSTPSPSSPVYTGPINIYFTQTLKAISVVNGQSSSVASATYTLDSEKWPAPNATDSTPLQLELQVPATAIP